jgi:hypothetical protein
MEFTDEQVDEIIKNSPQKHKEKDYDYGWESRFQTWYILSQEFGFVYYNKNEKLLISETGHKLIDNYKSEEPNDEIVQDIFLNAMMKYQSDNPFKKNSNSNVPLLLLLKVLKLLKNDKNENGSGVYRNELSLFICWNNDDALSLYKMIKSIRSKVKFSYSDEYMYDICLEILGFKTSSEKEAVKKYYKIDKICGEAVDEYIRKMRSTGIISLRGNGRFLDINSFESKRIDYVLENYSNYKKIESKMEYYNYLGTIDSNIVNIHNNLTQDLEHNVKLDTLYKYAEKYSKNEISLELLILANKKESKNMSFKFIPGPTRLEFLTSIYLVQNLSGCVVEPNYTIDDEGLPTMTAKGNLPDIICTDDLNNISNVEVTLMTSKIDQVTNEIIPIRRHLLSQIKNDSNAFALLIAPFLHEDTKECAKWYKEKDNIDIYTCTIEEFANHEFNSISKLRMES